MKLRNSLMAGVILVSMAFSVTACAKVDHYDEDDFLEICEEELNTDEDEMYRVTDMADGGYYFRYGSAVVYYVEYDSEKDAKKEFNNILDDFEDAKQDSSNHKLSDVSVKLKDHGYLVIKGEIDDEYFYGGYYWSEDTIIMVVTTQDDDGSRKAVDEVIEAFGYKKP